jgi:hypothetical protein
MRSSTISWNFDIQMDEPTKFYTGLDDLPT